MAENRELALVLKLVADQFQSELKRQEGALQNFNNFINNWKTQLVAAGAAMFAIAKTTANYGDELLKTSQKVGVNIEVLAGFQYAAKLADVSNDQLSKGLKFLSQNMAEAARGAGDGEALLRRLGISATTTGGQLRLTEDVLLDIAEAFANAEMGANKTEMAVKLFGKAGYELIPFLNQGKVGIKELMEEARRFGLIVTEEAARASEKFNDDLKRLEQSIKGITITIGTELISIFQDLAEAVGGFDGNTAAKNFVEWIRAIRFGFKDLVISVAEFNAQVVVLGSNILDIFSEEKAKALGERLDRIHQMAEDLRVEAAGKLSGTSGGEKVPRDGNQSGGIDSGPLKADTEALKVQFAARVQAVKDNLDLMKVGFAREKQMVEASLAEGRVSYVQAAESRNQLREQELVQQSASIQQQMVLAETMHEGRKRLGFETKEAETKDATDHLKLMADLSQQQRLLAAQQVNAQLEGQTDIQAAQSQTAKEQLTLLFQGTASMAADRETRQAEIVALAQAWVQYDEQVGASTELRAQHMTDVIAASLAQETDLTVAEMRTLLGAWTNHESEVAEMILSKTSLTLEQKEALELRALTRLSEANEKTSDDIFAGWATGMQRYVRDTKSGFGLGADMARRTAQAMEQGFKTFFFDVMDNKIKSFKDLMVSMLGFVKQIIAQIAAQLVTAQILKFALSFASPVAGNSASGASMFAATGGEVIRRFAAGGPVLGFGTSDSVPALLTPGEYVLSRNDVSEIRRGAAGGNTIVTNVNVSGAGGSRSESGAGAAPNFAQLARDLSKLVESKIIDEQRPGGLLARGVA